MLRNEPRGKPTYVAHASKMKQFTQQQLTVFLKDRLHRQPKVMVILILVKKKNEDKEDKEEGDSSVSAAKRSKHHDSFDPVWTEDFPWLINDANGKDGPGIFCSLCQKYNEVSKCMVWTVIPCKLFRKDKLCEHEKTQLHQNSVKAEMNALAAQRTGGISACLEEKVSLRRQAVKAAYKCAYWLIG